MFYCYGSAILGPGRLAVLERWLPYTVTIIDRFHCIVCLSSLPVMATHTNTQRHIRNITQCILATSITHSVTWCCLCAVPISISIALPFGDNRRTNKQSGTQAHTARKAVLHTV